MILIQKQIRGQNVQVLLYESSMNDQLIKLDQTAQMQSPLGGIMKSGRDFQITYDEIIKYKGYNQGFVLVARIKNKSIIGKICVGLKEVILFGNKQKAAYLFDMRIDQSHQRGGVGTLMIEGVQLQAKNYNFTVMVCSINHHNAKSVNFFLKTLKFSVGSQRKIYVGRSLNQKFNKKQQFKLKDQSICKIQFFQRKNQAQNKLFGICQQQYDYSLVNFQQITTNPKYLGYITAQNNQNQAMFHIFQGDNSFGMKIQKFIFPIKYWDKLYVRFLVMTFLMAGPLTMIYKSIDWNLFSVINKGLLSGGIALSLIFGFIQIAFYKVKSMALAPFLRIFGYQFNGNKNQQEIIQKLIQQIRKYSKTTGADLIRLNEDVRSNYLPYIKKDFTTFGNRVDTIFVYKLMNKSGQNDKQFSIKNFFDPRDI